MSESSSCNKMDIQGDVNPQRDFAGRDINHFTQNFLQPREIYLSPRKLPRPTVSSNLVHRGTEADYYRSLLESENVAFICGNSGVGKTTLAKFLITTLGKSKEVIFYCCTKHDTILSVITKLAQHVAESKDDEILQAVNRLYDIEKPNLVGLLDMMFVALSKQDCILCLCDLHLLITDRYFEGFCERLLDLAKDKFAKVLITSRRRFSCFPEKYQEHELVGWTLSETEDFLRQTGLFVNETISRQLWKLTSGYPSLVLITCSILRSKSKKEDFIRGIDTDEFLKEQSIEEKLAEYVWSAVDNNAKPVMQGIAIAHGWGVTNEALTEIVETSNELSEVLRFLTRDFLIRRTHEERNDLEEAGKTKYIQDSVIETYCYYKGIKSDEERANLHLKAARYYTKADRFKRHRDASKAAFHYFCSGKIKDSIEELRLSAEVLLADFRYHLHIGRSQMLMDMLNKYEAIHNDDEYLGDAELTFDNQLWSLICLAQGDAYTFLQNDEQAKLSYQKVVELLNTSNLSPIQQEMKARAYIGLAIHLKDRMPSEAIHYLNQALDKLDQLEQKTKIELSIWIGVTQLRQRQFDDALKTLQKASIEVQQMPNGSISNRLRFLVELNIGNIHYYKNELAESINAYDKAQKIVDHRQSRDPFNALSVRINRTAFEQIVGRWSDLSNSYQDVFERAERLGNKLEQARVQLNWGVFHLHKGDYVTAQLKLDEAFALADKNNINIVVIPCRTYLAELYVQRGDLTLSQNELHEALRLIETKNNFVIYLPHAQYVQALLFMKLSDYQQALEFATNCVDVSEASGMRQEQGQGLRVRGQIQTHLKQFDDADTSFRESACLLEKNRFELALTQEAWGQMLLAMNELDRGQSLLSDAQKIFAELGVTNRPKST